MLRRLTDALIVWTVGPYSAEIREIGKLSDNRY